MKFIRWGSLVPQYHEIDVDDDRRWFHTAPVEYGFYAFPKGYVEPFLLGGVGCGSLQNGRRSKIRDESGKPITGIVTDFKWKDESDYGIWKWKSEWKTFFKRRKLKERDVSLYAFKSQDQEQSDMIEGDMPEEIEYYLVVENPPNMFEYTGNVWSHIDTYYVRCGEYGSSDSSSKEKVIIKPADILRREGSWVLTDIKTYQRALKTYVSWMRYDDTKTDKYSNTGNAPMHHHSKDEFEVFIESLQT